MAVWLMHSSISVFKGKCKDYLCDTVIVRFFFALFCTYLEQLFSLVEVIGIYNFNLNLNEQRLTGFANMYYLNSFFSPKDKNLHYW